MDIQSTLEHEQIAEIKQYIAQIAHDIRSPLACLRMFIASCNGLLPRDQNVLQAIISNIEAIANSILGHCSLGTQSNQVTSSSIECISLLGNIVAAKRVEYQASKVQFKYEVSQAKKPVYIAVNSVDFNRMLSNVINNAVDALDGWDGEVSIQVQADTEIVKIIIQDNGKGMPREVINKILNKEAITMGKSNGHGIGMAQVNNVLTRYQGKLSIDSVQGQGTTITLNFPLAEAV
jgi:signal transduction histidine kinase